jgi:hypothetical protein
MNVLKLVFIVMLLVPGAASGATLTEKFEKDYIPLGSATGAVSFAVADFDSDGKADGIAALDSKGGRVLAFSFSGPGQMWTVSTPDIVAGSSDGTVIAGDLDGDGKSSDIIAGAKGIFAINSGTVMWKFGTAGSIYSLAMIDLDGDGKANEIVAGGFKNVYALDENGISLWNFTDVSGAVETVSGIDFNKDGVPEAVLLASAKIFYVLDKDGNRLWNKIASDIVYSMISVDFDNDGYLTDIVVGSGDGNVTALNSEGAYLWEYRAYVDPGNKIKLYPADLSSTGIFSNVVVNADQVHALNSAGTRAWSGTFTGNVMALVDFNGDGIKEGVVTGTSSKIYAISPTGQQVGYYLKDNDAKEGPYNVTGATALSAADLDGDGYLDDIFGVTNGAYFALAHTTDAPAPVQTTSAPVATTAAPVTTAPPVPGEVTVDAGEDKTVTGGTVTTLSADASASLDTGNIVSYIWTEDNTVLGQEKTLSKIFEPGEHTIKIEVTDNTGAKSYDIIKVVVIAQETPTPTAAPAEQTSPVLMVLLGVGIGVAIVGAILFYMKKKGPEDEWV